jgi:hypothetical protein
VIEWLLSGLARGGGPSSWLTGADIIAYHESGYDPRAINLNDINAQRGDPSKGLMQVISAHFLPGEDPFDPIDNVTAATRYIRSRYKDMYNVPGPKSVLAGGSYLPYANGGYINEPVSGIGMRSGSRYLLGESGTETVVPGKLTVFPDGSLSVTVIKMPGMGGNAGSVPAPVSPAGAGPNGSGLPPIGIGKTGGIGGKLPGPGGLDAPIVGIFGGKYPSLPSIANPYGPNGGMFGPKTPPAAGPHPLMPNGIPDYGAGGQALLNAAQQMTMARTTGKYYPGELAPNDPAILAMIAEYKRLGGTDRDPTNSGKFDAMRTRAPETNDNPLGALGTMIAGAAKGANPLGALGTMIANAANPLGGVGIGALGPLITGGSKWGPYTPGNPFGDIPGIPDSPGKGSPPPAGATGGGSKTLVVRVVSTETLIDGITVTREIVSDPVAIETMAEGVTEVQATWERGEQPTGAVAVTPSARPTGGAWPTGPKIR